MIYDTAGGLNNDSECTRHPGCTRYHNGTRYYRQQFPRGIAEDSFSSLLPETAMTESYLGRDQSRFDETYNHIEVW